MNYLESFGGLIIVSLQFNKQVSVYNNVMSHCAASSPKWWITIIYVYIGSIDSCILPSNLKYLLLIPSEIVVVTYLTIDRTY